MKVTIHPAASSDIEAEVFYYESKGNGLGKAFADEVEAAVAKIAEFPSAYPIKRGSVRICPLDRFPFQVGYRLLGQIELEVLVVRHRRREMSYGINRAV